MRPLFSLLILPFLFLYFHLFSQQENLEVDGAIKIGNTSNSSPAPGTIKWNGMDFLGWNGSNWVSLISGIVYSGEVTDVDGNTYQTVKIGDQEWMAQNLRTSRYRDSTEIPNVESSTTWQTLTTGAFCWYDNDSSTYEKPYGKLYNWYTVDDASGLCPTGWDVPEVDDFIELYNFLGGNGIAGGALKSFGLAYWKNPNTDATDGVGFSALGTGFRTTTGTFSEVFETTSIHTTNDINASTSVNYIIAHDNQILDGAALNKKYGLTVRCVKD